ADQERQFVSQTLFGQPRHIAMHDTCVHAELRLHKLGAGVDLGLQPGRFPSCRRIDWIVGAAEEKIKIAANLAARREFADIAEPPCRIKQRAWIEIKDSFGIGLITGAGVVAAQHQKIANTRCGGTQQVTLQRDTITIAAGQLEDRLYALLDKKCSRNDRAKM